MTNVKSELECAEEDDVSSENTNSLLVPDKKLSIPSTPQAKRDSIGSK